MDALAVCTRGLEEVLDAELASLGIKSRRTAKGGITFRGSTRDLYKANVWLRSASRVVVRIGRFRATTFRDLEREIATLDWDAYLDEYTLPRLRVSSGSSRLHHTGAIAERILKALGVDPAFEYVEGPDAPATQAFVVRATHDEFTISVDASGENLHRRGWRQATAKAPLRESLAGAMVLASGWRGERPLLDPMCGSGTIAIEAALLAQGRAPGANRSFAFQQWPTFEPGTWASVRADVTRAETEAAGRALPLIIAADRDAGGVAAATANAARAGVADVVTIERSALAETLATRTAPDEPSGLILTNPPYGARVGGRDLRDLYATLGRAGTWDVGMLIANRSLAGHTKLTLDERFRTTNGGIPVTFAQTPPRT